jgi:zinc/manganese transport system substrate-binding protein
MPDGSTRLHDDGSTRLHDRCHVGGTCSGRGLGLDGGVHRPGMLRPTRALGVAIGLAVTVTACASSDRSPSTPTPPARRLSVVATTTIWGDVVRSVVGDDADVRVLTTSSDDPRTFAPAPDRAGELSGADVVVTTGLGFEAGLAPALALARADGVEVVEVAPLVGPADTAFGAPDPHVWLDADRLSTIARSLADLLARRAATDGSDPGGGSGDAGATPADRWSARADAFAEVVATADEQAQAALNPLPDDRRRASTASDGLGYLAERYGVVLSPLAPGAAGHAFAADVDQLGPPGSATGTTPALLADTARRLAAFLAG